MMTTQRLTLNEDLTIYHALEQKNQLLDALSASETLELDLLQVSDIDTAGLQLLILLKKEALRTGKRVAIVAHSAAMWSNDMRAAHTTTTAGPSATMGSNSSAAMLRRKRSRCGLRQVVGAIGQVSISPTTGSASRTPRAAGEQQHE